MDDDVISKELKGVIREFFICQWWLLQINQYVCLGEILADVFIQEKQGFV